MTAREIMIRFGYELDKTSESKVESGVQNLKDTASQLLGGLEVGFSESGLADMARDFGEVTDSISEAVEESEALQSTQETLLETVEDLGDSYEDMMETVEQLPEIQETVEDIVEKNEEWVETNEDITESIEDMGKGYEDLEDSIESATKSTKDLEKSVEDVEDACHDLVDSFPDKIPIRFEVDKTSEALAQASIQKLHNFASGLLGAISVGFSIVNMTALMEEFGAVNQQIKNAVDGMEDVGQAQEAILHSSNALRMSYEDTAAAVSTLVSSSPDLFSLDEAIAYNEATTKLFKASGKSNEEVASLMESINQSFQKGYVDSGTISTLLENSPSSIELLNQRLGTTSDQLEALADVGAISIDDLKYAFLDNAEAINESFGEVRFNITDALLHIRNTWGFWLADLDETYGITEAIGTAMVKAFTWGMNILDQIKTRVEWFIEKLGGVENALKLIGIIGASVMGAVLLPKIFSVISAIKNMDKALLMAKLKMMAIVMVVILLALMIEDFICFMKGEDSVIGKLFEKAGIDAEAAREKIISAWNAVKDFLANAWETLKNIAKTVLQALATWWEENGEYILAQMKRLWEAIVRLCSALWNGLKTLAIAIFEALKAFWERWGETIIEIFFIIINTLIALIGLVIDALIAFIDFLTSIFTGDWQGAWDAICRIVTACFQAIITLLQGAWDIICAICGIGNSNVQDIFENMGKGVADKISSIVDTIINGLFTAIEFITSLPGLAFTWGKDIILGIVSGLKSAMGPLTSAISNVASHIRSYLGFSVPETGPLSDADTYMPDMMDLMEEGIGATKYRVLDAVSELAGEMSDEVQGEMEAPSLPMPELSGGISYLQDMADLFSAHQEEIVEGVGLFQTCLSASSQGNDMNPTTQNLAEYGNHTATNVNQTVTITNEFHGDLAGQGKSAEAMGKATDDISGELARALAVT